jgi:hypothetical protein
VTVTAGLVVADGRSEGADPAVVLAVAAVLAAVVLAARGAVKDA